MRKYYIYYWADFANTYNLLYAEPGDPIPDDAERITRADRRTGHRPPGIRPHGSPAGTAPSGTSCTTARRHNPKNRRY